MRHVLGRVAGTNIVGSIFGSGRIGCVLGSEHLEFELDLSLALLIC
jgi:hypothetical protein